MSESLAAGPLRDRIIKLTVDLSEQLGMRHSDEMMVVFESEDGEAFTITSVTYEEDLAGAIVLRGEPIPDPGAS